MIAALAALTGLGVFSILVSEMPKLPGWPLAVLTGAYGAWLIRREARKPNLSFVWPGGEGVVTLEGEAIHEVALQWRGPLAFIRWRDEAGRIRRASWWPDTLSPAARRELRLAAPPLIASRQSGAVAP